MKIKSLKPPRAIKRYSESFKLSVLKEMSTYGKTNSEMCAKYGMAGDTLRQWIKKYNRKELITRKIRIEMPEEVNQIKLLKKRITELEKALVKTQLDHLRTASLLECAIEDLGYSDKGEYEKKQEAKRSKKQ